MTPSDSSPAPTSRANRPSHRPFRRDHPLEIDQVTIKKLLAVLAFVAVSANAQTIKPEAIRAHMRFLSDDLLEGRGTGTRGYQLAAEYVAAQYQSFGLKPGAGKSYLQNVPFRQTVAQAGSEIALTRDAGSETLQFETD